MVARDVADWDEDSNTYNASIELYKHDSKIVGVCDVKDLIIEEIKKFLEEKGYDLCLLQWKMHHRKQYRLPLS